MKSRRLSYKGLLVSAVWGNAGETKPLMLNEAVNITTMSVRRLNVYPLTSRHGVYRYRAWDEVRVSAVGFGDVLSLR